jgi:hypothetical protein
MIMRLSSLALAGLFLGSVLPASAQDAPIGTKRPKILRIYREEVKPGRQPAHEKNEAGWPAALRKANNKGYYLAMSSGAEAWFLNPFPSYAAMEARAKEDDANTALTTELDRLWALDGEMLSRSGAIIAELNEDLSYRSDWDTAKMRYYGVTILRVQPGYGREFEQIRKAVVAAHEKAKVDERWALYSVNTGAPDDTYIFLFAVNSLAEWDKSEAMHGKEYQEALGEDMRGRIRAFNQTAVKYSESMLFNFSPRMSYLPKEWIDRDPDFWAPKPAAPAAAKKDEKKP